MTMAESNFRFRCYRTPRIKTSAELAFERDPANRCDALQRVKAVAEPSVQVESHAVIADSSDRGFVEWNGMGRKLIEELLGEFGDLGERPTLPCPAVRKNGLVEDVHSTNTAELIVF